LIEFLDWVARAGGIIAVLTIGLGFIFREKWKQILQRSLAEDLERLKAELSKDQVEHAASLTPQLEQIKHDFQQKLEAYKVSLIAEAEAVKAKGELRKNIALRYAEIEFQRMVELEYVIASLATNIVAMSSLAPEFKTADDKKEAIGKLLDLGRTMEGVAMYFTTVERLELSKFRKAIVDIATQHIGPGTLVLADEDQRVTDLHAASSGVEDMVRTRIKALAML
jgi:hypothetical protein